MTTETRHTSISEDWEELDAISGEDGIYDDTASILSLSTTVAESEDYDTSDGAASKDHVTDAQESSSLPIRDRAPAGTNPTQDDDADSIASADTITRDLLDVVVEPPILLSTLDSLQSTLNEIIPLCGDQNSTNGHDAVQGVSEALHRLLGTIMDLKEVVSCYVRLWNPNDPFSRTPPLDPTLYKWCSDCAIELYKLRAEFGQQAAKTAPFPNWNCYSDDLNRFCEDMSVFLPIMRVDLDEYQTPRLNFPSYPASQQAPPHQSFLHRRYRSPDSEEVVTGPIPALRRRLYVLKDEIGKTNGIIDDCKITKVFSEDNETKLSQIQAIQTCTFRDLAILLSNHGSDWIDQTLAGGLSYAEFTDLDPQTIQAFEMRFSKFGSLLDELRWSLSYTRSDGDKVVPKQAHFFSEQKYAKSSSHDAQCNAPGNDIANVVDFEGVKAMITKLNSLLKVKVEEEKEQKEKNEEMDAECEKS